ncbi:hypothetical protein CGLO_14171 [Colletotrichum gloeosporioides Cg-14]
MRMQY